MQWWSVIKLERLGGRKGLRVVIHNMLLNVTNRFVLCKKTWFFQEIALNSMKDCRNHSEGITNQKIWFFWFETVSQKNSQLRKKIKIFALEKNFPDFFWDFFRKLKKVKKINEKSYEFSLKILTFIQFSENFQKNQDFFSRAKKIYSELEIFWRYNLNQKNHIFRLVWFLERLESPRQR